MGRSHQRRAFRAGPSPRRGPNEFAHGWSSSTGSRRRSCTAGTAPPLTYSPAGSAWHAPPSGPSPSGRAQGPGEVHLREEYAERREVHGCHGLRGTAVVLQPVRPDPGRTHALRTRPGRAGLHRPVDGHSTAPGDLTRATTLPAHDMKDLGDPAPDGHPAITAGRTPKKLGTRPKPVIRLHAVDRGCTTKRTSRNSEHLTSVICLFVAFFASTRWIGLFQFRRSASIVPLWDESPLMLH